MQRQQGSAAGGPAAATAHRPSSEPVFELDLIVGIQRLTAAELAALGPDDLLPMPHSHPVAPAPAGAFAAGRSAAPSAAAPSASAAAPGLPMQLSLGRTALCSAVLAGGALRFIPLDPIPPTSGSDTRPTPGPAPGPTSGPAPAPPGSPASGPLPHSDAPPHPDRGQNAMTPDPGQFELDVSLRFGSMRMTLAQLAALRPGQTIPTSAGADEPEVDIVVDGRVVGAGKLVRIGTHWAVSITRWGTDGN